MGPKTNKNHFHHSKKKKKKSNVIRFSKTLEIRFNFKFLKIA